jgi:hypothetical protein
VLYPADITGLQRRERRVVTNMGKYLTLGGQKIDKGLIRFAGQCLTIIKKGAVVSHYVCLFSTTLKIASCNRACPWVFCKVTWVKPGSFL